MILLEITGGALYALIACFFVRPLAGAVAYSNANTTGRPDEIDWAIGTFFGVAAAALWLPGVVAIGTLRLLVWTGPHAERGIRGIGTGVSNVTQALLKQLARTFDAPGVRLGAEKAAIRRGEAEGSTNELKGRLGVR